MATPQLGIVPLADGQNQAEILINDTVDKLEAFGFFKVKERNAVTPPGSPAIGDLYHLGGAPTGLWSGQAGKIAGWFESVWRFFSPLEGWKFWVNDENQMFAYNGSSWLAYDLRADILYRKHLNMMPPGAAEDRNFFRTDVAITIKLVSTVLVTAVGSPSVTWRLKHATDRNAAGTDVITSSPVTATSITTGTNHTAFASASIPADSFLWVETSASNLVGTDQMLVEVEYVAQEPAA
jgi:hypothetical protein